MGACCGGTVPPENIPNTDSSAKFDTARASTLLKESDPELQKLIKQQQSQDTNIVQTDEDEEKKPLNTNENESNDNDTSNTAKSIEKDISTAAINVPGASKQSKKRHQKVPSESIDSAIITETQTMVIHENVGTTAPFPAITASTSADTEPILAQSSIDGKLAILNEENDTNNTFRKSSSSSDMFERKPSAKQQISDAYLLRMDDIKTWSDNISEPLANNNLKHCMDACKQTIEECDCIKRLVFILKLYNQCINDNKSDVSIEKIMEYLSPYEDYQCINDYFHFSDHHQIQYKHMNDIRNYFVSQCGDCNENKCVSFIRNHRDKYKKMTDQYYNCDDDNYKLIAIQQIFDSIHCAIFHHVMYNNDNISEKDNKQRKITIIRKRHCNFYTIDTGIQDIKTDEEIQYELEQKIQQQVEQENKMPELRETAPSIHSMASQLTKLLQQQTSTPSITPKNKLRSKNTSKLVSPKIPCQRPNSIFEGDMKDPNYIASEREYTYLPYSFGQHMFYDHDHEFTLPTYSDLKKELVLNTKAPLSEYQFMIEDKKAEILKKTYKIPADMTLDQIVSVLVYCNYNALRQELQRSFATKTEHKSYFHWGQLLFSVVRQFGVVDELKTFPAIYCALNYPYKFYSFTHFNFTGLFSTSNNVNVVECSNTFRDGMILKLNRAPFWQAQFINLSVVYSDFKDEQQQLFGCLNGCVLKIDEIFTFHDIRENTVSYKHRNKKFIGALQLFEQIVIDIPYIDNEEQYKWLKNSVEHCEEKSDDFDDNEYTIMQILENMIYECLSEDSDRRLSAIKKHVEIPTFIKTQFGYFGHYYRETEFCKLCFDSKKIEMLPREIQKYFMNDKVIIYGNWCKLFPNDRIICVKNVEANKYESFINLFATFVNEIGPSCTDSLQCVEINTNVNTFDENINDMIDKKNKNKFKYVNWTLSYEVMTNVHSEIGNENKQNNYSILISKNEVVDVEAKTDDNNVSTQEDIQVEDNTNGAEAVVEEPLNDKQEDVKVEENINEVEAVVAEPVNDEQNVETQQEIVDNIEVQENEIDKKDIEQDDTVVEEPVNDTEIVEETVDDVENENENENEEIVKEEMDENETGNIEVIESSEEQENEADENDNNKNQIDDRASVNNEDENVNEEIEKEQSEIQSEIINEQNENKANVNEEIVKEQNENKEVIENVNDKENTEPVLNMKESDNISSPSTGPLLDADKVSELQSHVSQLQNEEHKQTSTENTPQSVDTWGTSSPQPFANRWDNASTAEDNTPTSVPESTPVDKTEKKEDQSENNENNLVLEDTIWNSYIDKWGYEPKTPSQLQLFSKNPEFEQHLSFKNAKLHFNKRKGSGKIPK